MTGYNEFLGDLARKAAGFVALVNDLRELADIAEEYGDVLPIRPSELRRVVDKHAPRKVTGDE